MAFFVFQESSQPPPDLQVANREIEEQLRDMNGTLNDFMGEMREMKQKEDIRASRPLQTGKPIGENSPQLQKLVKDVGKMSKQYKELTHDAQHNRRVLENMSNAVYSTAQHTDEHRRVIYQYFNHSFKCFEFFIFLGTTRSI